jgi:hypothetical protein
VVQDAVVTTELTDAVERVWREQGGKLWRSLVAITADADVASDAMGADGTVTRMSLGG